MGGPQNRMKVSVITSSLGPWTGH
ncbi:protein of unknown function [Streptantibioticus cattleyicolor NRRL 8057 = DSM 46488]|nr:protein of unknown function [Streptantibioticus cattleyicolor NRRL 8057 = DSM 46488]